MRRWEDGPRPAVLEAEAAGHGGTLALVFMFLADLAGLVLIL